MSAGERPEEGPMAEELEPAEALEELLEEVVEGLGLDVEIEVDAGPGLLGGRITGEDVGLFIGRRGQTIDAVQHLAQRIVFPGGPSPVRVVVDADGYRERRSEMLRADADDAAEEAPVRAVRSSWPRCHRPSGGWCTSTYASAAAWKRTARARSRTAIWSYRPSATDRRGRPPRGAALGLDRR